MVLLLCVVTVGLSLTEAKAQQSANRTAFAQYDLRGQSPEFIEAAAIRSSAGTVSLVVRTPYKGIWTNAYDVAQEVAKQGYPASLLLAADGPDQLEVYAKGVLIGRIRHPGMSAESKQLIKDEMIRAHDLAFGSR